MSGVVTIGVPCYNAERWIETAVRSALEQTWSFKEVIVVDDGSTDASASILETFGKAIQVRRTVNRGVNHARNEILRLAQGDWIQYLDADDYLLPRKIETQFAEAPPAAKCDLIYSPVLVERWENDRPAALFAEAIDSGQDLPGQWLTWEMPQTGGCLWKRKLLNELEGWDENEKICDEHDLYFRAMQRDAAFAYAPTPGAVYRIWSEDTRCRRDKRLVVQSKTALMHRFIHWMQERKLWTEGHRKIAGRGFFEMARTLASVDLQEASIYHRKQEQQDLMHLAGPAAPLHYRIVYRLAGFDIAEQLARALR